MSDLSQAITKALNWLDDANERHIRYPNNTTNRGLPIGYTEALYLTDAESGSPHYKFVARKGRLPGEIGASTGFSADKQQDLFDLLNLAKSDIEQSHCFVPGPRGSDGTVLDQIRCGGTFIIESVHDLGMGCETFTLSDGFLKKVADPSKPTAHGYHLGAVQNFIAFAATTGLGEKLLDQSSPGHAFMRRLLAKGVTVIDDDLSSKLRLAFDVNVSQCWTSFYDPDSTGDHPDVLIYSIWNEPAEPDGQIALERLAEIRRNTFAAGSKLSEFLAAQESDEAGSWTFGAQNQAARAVFSLAAKSVWRDDDLTTWKQVASKKDSRRKFARATFDKWVAGSGKSDIASFLMDYIFDNPDRAAASVWNESMRGEFTAQATKQKTIRGQGKSVDYT